MKTPEDIARVISEQLAPGCLGLAEDEQGQQGQQDDPGDILVVRKMADEIGRLASELRKFVDRNNIRGARAVIAELSGALEQAETQCNRLAASKGLVGMKVNNTQ